jgi:hypothetical protein
MSRSLVAGVGLALTIVGVPSVARAAPESRLAPAARKTPATKKKTPATKKKTPALVSNPSRWHRYQGRVVRRIEITGLRRTRAWRLEHWLDTRVGRPFDAETLRHDVRRIRNLELFRPIRVRVDPEGRGVVIRIQAKDKWSLLPYFNMFFNLGSVNVITGIYDVNTLGFLSYVDLQLMLFSYLPVTDRSIRPGFLLSLEVPRLARLPLYYDLSVRAQMSIRTIIGTLLQPVGYFQTERYGGYHSLTWEPFQWLRLGVRELLYYHRSLLGSLGYTSYRDYMQHGLIFSFALEGASKHLGSDFEYVSFAGVCRAYYRFGPRGGNLAARVGGGYMKGGSFSNLFALGSWTGLRGFYTAQFTARSYVYGNLEYRTGLLRTGFPIASIIPYFRGRVFQLQGAVFADVGGVAGGGAYRTDEHGKPLVAIGAGFRASVVNLYKAILRVDFAYTLSPYRSYDLIIATQQYF